MIQPFMQARRVTECQNGGGRRATIELVTQLAPIHEQLNYFFQVRNFPRLVKSEHDLRLNSSCNVKHPCFKAPVIILKIVFPKCIQFSILVPCFQEENACSNSVVKKASSGEFESLHSSASREKVRQISEQMEHILDSVEVKYSIKLCTRWRSRFCAKF